MKPIILNDQGGSVMSVSSDVVSTLRAQDHGHPPVVVDTLVFDASQITSPTNGNVPKHGDPCHTLSGEAGRAVVIIETASDGGNMLKKVFDSSRRHDCSEYKDICETVQAAYGTGGNNVPLVLEKAMNNEEPTMVEMTSTKNTIVKNGVSPTLTARMGSGGNQVNAVCMDVGFFQTFEEQTGTMLARQYKDPPITVQNKTGEAANDMYVVSNIVRRLTPLECERLQGFPDGWTDIGEWVDSKGKKHKAADSPRYKALGNSIAIPFWEWMAGRICALYDRPVRLGSLFDGIGGFPLSFQKHGGIPVWASEIEEFPIAVTKMRFPDDG